MAKLSFPIRSPCTRCTCDAHRRGGHGGCAARADRVKHYNDQRQKTEAKPDFYPDSHSDSDSDTDSHSDRPTPSPTPSPTSTPTATPTPTPSPTGASYSLTATQSPDGLTVNWTAPSGTSPQDWIGLYRVGADAYSYLWWQYTAGAISGRLNVPVPPAGDWYEFRYLLSNGFTQTAHSAPFTVNATPTPTVTPTVTPGPTATATPIPTPIPTATATPGPSTTPTPVPSTTPTPIPGPLDTPTNLRVVDETLTGPYFNIAVAWDYPAADPDRFRLEYSTNGGSTWALWGNRPGSEAPNTSRSTGGKTFLPPSASAPRTPRTTPRPGRMFRSIVLGSTSRLMLPSKRLARGDFLSWSMYSRSVTEVEVQYAPTGTADWSAGTVVPYQDCGLTISGLTPGTAYDFRMRGKNEATGAVSPWVRHFLSRPHRVRS